MPLGTIHTCRQCIQLTSTTVCLYVARTGMYSHDPYLNPWMVCLVSWSSLTTHETEDFLTLTKLSNAAVGNVTIFRHVLRPTSTQHNLKNHVINPHLKRSMVCLVSLSSLITDERASFWLCKLTSPPASLRCKPSEAKGTKKHTSQHKHVGWVICYYKLGHVQDGMETTIYQVQRYSGINVSSTSSPVINSKSELLVVQAHFASFQLTLQAKA